MKRTGARENSASRVDRMLAAARESGPERLSGEIRDRILNEALRAGDAADPLPTLFTPLRRLVVAGTLPVLLAVALLVGSVPQDPQVQPSAPSSIQVSKQGNRVLFTIANGKEAHRVVRSDAPNRFDGTGVAVTDTYSEGLSDGTDLVFYRID